jgi:hypothetical protein
MGTFLYPPKWWKGRLNINRSDSNSPYPLGVIGGLGMKSPPFLFSMMSFPGFDCSYAFS